MTQPIVSVVITCYNYARYVGGAIESVLNQSFQDIEIIIVDDGSTDGSDTVISSFLFDHRIKYFHQENRGQAKAKNKGIKESTGEFVAFLDADDQWEKTKLEKQILLFQNQDTGVVYSRAQYIDAAGHPMELILSDKYLQPRSGKVTNWLYMNNFVPFSSAIVRKTCFDMLGMFDESLSMGIDWDLWLRISTRYSFAYVNEPLLLYRVGHPGQMSKNETTRHECSDRIMMSFVDNYPDAVDPKVQKKAKVYTLWNRADYYSVRKPWQGMLLSLKAILLSPFHPESYRGVLQALRYLFFHRTS